MILKLFVGACLLFLNSAESDADIIEWTEERKLTWADFNAPAEIAAFYVASTNSGIKFSYSFSTKGDKTTVTSTVKSIFHPDKSWFKPGKVNNKILAHEQAHFDISELFARKLRKKMDKSSFSKNIKSEIESIYKANEIERQTMQKRFDKETDHSKIAKAEEEWETFIALQLKAHDDYK